MKTLLLILSLAASTQLSAAEATKEEKAAVCDVMEKVARQVMSVRQDKSVPLKTVLGIMNTENARSIVLMAWEKPSFSTDAMQQKTISEFADNIYLQCLKVNNI